MRLFVFFLLCFLVPEIGTAGELSTSLERFGKRVLCEQEFLSRDWGPFQMALTHMKKGQRGWTVLPTHLLLEDPEFGERVFEYTKKNLSDPSEYIGFNLLKPQSVKDFIHFFKNFPSVESLREFPFKLLYILNRFLPQKERGKVTFESARSILSYKPFGDGNNHAIHYDDGFEFTVITVLKGGSTIIYDDSDLSEETKSHTVVYTRPPQIVYDSKPGDSILISGSERGKGYPRTLHSRPYSLDPRMVLITRFKTRH